MGDGRLPVAPARKDPDLVGHVRQRWIRLTAAKYVTVTSPHHIDIIKVIFSRLSSGSNEEPVYFTLPGLVQQSIGGGVPAAGY